MSKMITFSSDEVSDAGFVTVSLVAKKLGVCSQTIRRSIADGTLTASRTPQRPSIKKGHFRLKPKDVRDWADRCSLQ